MPLLIVDRAEIEFKRIVDAMSIPGVVPPPGVKLAKVLAEEGKDVASKLTTELIPSHKGVKTIPKAFPTRVVNSVSSCSTLFRSLVVV